LEICSNLDKSLASRLVGVGIPADRLSNLMNAASRSCRTNLKNAFQGIAAVATDTQRDLNRSLLPMVQQHMAAGYGAVLMAQGGMGCFQRMKWVMTNHTQAMTETMFQGCTTELLQAIDSMVRKLSAMISAVVDIIVKTFDIIYSVLWDDQSEKSMHIDPEELDQIRACRDGLLPVIHAIMGRIGKAMDLMGIKRPQLDLDVMGVESWDVQNQRKLSKAQQQGMIVDLCDDDDDSNPDQKAPGTSFVVTMADRSNLAYSSVGIKAEKDSTAASKREVILV